MKEEKGKGIAKDQSAPDDRSEQEPSILSRVTASAAGLTRSVFAAPNHNEVNEAAAAALSSSGKGQSSRSNDSSAYAESSKAWQQPSQNANVSNGLRSNHYDQHIAQTESEFSSFLDGIPSFAPSTHDQPSESEPAIAPAVTWGDAWARSQQHEAVTPPEILQKQRTVQDQEIMDGAEVLDLLDTTNLTSHTFSNLPGEEIDENYDWGLSPAQLSKIIAITRELFPKSSQPHTQMPTDHPLNLIPRGENTDGNMSSPPAEMGVDEMYVGYEIDGNPVSGMQVWKKQWEGVLDRYTDEVWGDLLPLVEEARKEMEDVVEGEGTEEPVALRRLRGILGHLQQR